MRLCLVVFTCLFVGTLAIPGMREAKNEWNRFKAAHKKVYKNAAEDLLRFKVFLKNKLAIVNHNMKHRKGSASYVVEMNKYGDLLDHEFQKQIGVSSGPSLRILEPRSFRSSDRGLYSKSGKPIPPSVDWRTKNVVVPPRNQGTCASSWAFSTTGAIEGQLARKTGKLVPLSQQSLIDCSTENDGCDGGFMDVAFGFVYRRGGIVSEASYPYTGKAGKCKRFNRRDVGAQIKGTVHIRPGYASDLQDAIAQVGPISVAIDASSKMLRFYKSGVFSPSSSQCSPYEVNAGVLAVGYGKENGKEFWLLKNSWGTSWGEGGYFKLLKDGQNLCGVTSSASYPQL